MKALFSIVGLVVVLGVVGLLAKKQLGSVSAPPAVTVPASGSGSVDIPAGTPPQAVPQQFKSAVEATLQQPRAADDSK